MPRRNVVAAFALAASVALVLSSCSSGSGGNALEDYAGPPKGVTGLPTAEEPFAAWLGDGKRIAITLFGSSGCPPIVSRMIVGASNSLQATVEKIPDDKVCTADYVPHTTVFTTPEQVSTTSDVSIRFTGKPTITLPAIRP
ncbi:hypothetical protein E6C70_14610 [Glaciibacter flavus]|uniref:Lipoprotein n=1 Tax=Orlajensenia flava TaxID=2565934 RepID=A0A4S4FKR0_9MICO|nr:hypothetical protein [Glaciibacter flavus]THG30331.1 hypothetical protein E6C70_14890 [Glaciibacter flavus]THG30594.1 hypothetical protein E6C70_14610 [Glaciibacter flavus]